MTNEIGLDNTLLAARAFMTNHPDASPETVAEALTAQGIPIAPDLVTFARSLGPLQKQVPAKPKKAPRKKTARTSGAADAKAILEAIVGMTDKFCQDHLNDEYAEMCRDLAAALGRKRPSPLLRGEPKTWAVGIIRTIGWVNFLDDPSNKPHLKLTFIDKSFGVAESTGQGKSKLIRTMLKIYNSDPKWTLPSRIDDNPLIWLVSVNGFIIDIRAASRQLQVEAYELGLIPYVPADRNRNSDGDE